MGNIFFGCRHAGLCLRVGENAVNRVQNGAAGTERNRQLDFLKVFGTDFLLKITAHSFKFGRIGALKTVNRLFAVTHRKNRPHRIFGAEPAEEIAAQRTDNAPLFGRSILRFVNQNIINAAIKFEQNPIGNPGRFKKIAGQNNQILIIQPRMNFLKAVIAGNHIFGQIPDCPGSSQQLGAAPPVIGICQTLGLGGGNFSGSRIKRQRAFRCLSRPRFAAQRQKQTAIIIINRAVIG